MDPASNRGQRDKMLDGADEAMLKYPRGSVVTKLSSTLEIKQHWLYSEWAPECQFSKYISPHFRDRSELDPMHTTPNIALIESVFNSVRGSFSLWRGEKEEARWKKLVVPDLTLDWVEKNVEVLYGSTHQFPVTELNGIVLWSEKSESGEWYKLLEGNHRISAWRLAKQPATLSATIFIGKPKKLV